MFLRFFFGGGEGNRTPVLKLIDIVFSVRSASLHSPRRRADAQARRRVASFCHVTPQSFGAITFTAALRPVRSRSPHRQDGRRLGRQSYCVIVVYYLNVGVVA